MTTFSKDYNKDGSIATSNATDKALHRRQRARKAHHRSTHIDPRAYIRSSKLVNDQVDVLVSLVVRDFVDPWFKGISADDAFQSEIKRAIKIIFNRLEVRFTKVDWKHAILFELPDILRLHLHDVRQCHARLKTSYAGWNTSIEELYQAHHPHVALCAAADSELAYLRHLSENLLRVFLHSEARHDVVTRHFLREILACVVLRNAVEVTSDPSTLNEAIVKFLGKCSEREYFNRCDMSRYFTLPEIVLEKDASRRPEVASHPSVEQLLQEAQETPIAKDSAARHERRTHSTRPVATQQQPSKGDRHRQRNAAEPTLAPRQIDGANAPAARRHHSNGVGPPPPPPPPLPPPTARSFIFNWLVRDIFSRERWRGWRNYIWRGFMYTHLIVRQSFLALVSNLAKYTFSLNEMLKLAPQSQYRGSVHSMLLLLNDLFLFSQHQEWLWIQFVFYIFPIINILAGAAIDRLLVDTVDFILAEEQLAMYVYELHEALWPGGGPFRKDRPYHTLEQEELLHEDSVELLSELLPYIFNKLFYGLSASERRIAAQRILQPLQNRQLNKHLVYTILDFIMVKAAPELAQGGGTQRNMAAEDATCR
ncbi:hypothetical protein EV182_001850 [Spiromyces aspiralis]|uniref:Uncharacterized protein n=1 Tax=Spiromyces aspiralis TaxID=68401 RepID=A0ACC1HSV6_9FUNG|nr:hypothetical protein EV182_001850 [Spiromyces aspiralis]